MNNKQKKFFSYLILFFFLSGACFLLWQEIYFMRKSDSVETKIFSVVTGQGSRSIAINLEGAHLIKWGPLFRLYVFFEGIAGNLQAGVYELSPSMSIPEIAQKLASGNTIKIKATIPEGFNIKDIQETLSSDLQRTILFNLQVEVGDETKASSSPFASARVFKEEFSFLKDSPENASLEGFLFPDTYFFELDESDKEICVKFLKNFEEKFAPIQGKIPAMGKTIFETIVMASLLEKEVKTLEDKKLVSGILWKRLKVGMPLQVDATLNYITGKNNDGVSIADTKIDSPYNTYKYSGLPAGPIANPGLESMQASVYPESSGYWYYLSSAEGKTIFSKTLAEHNLARAKYLK